MIFISWRVSLVNKFGKFRASLSDLALIMKFDEPT